MTMDGNGNLASARAEHRRVITLLFTMWLPLISGCNIFAALAERATDAGVSSRDINKSDTGARDSNAVDAVVDVDAVPDRRVPDRWVADVAADLHVSDVVTTPDIFPEATGVDASALDTGAMDIARQDRAGVDLITVDRAAPDRPAPDTHTLDRDSPDNFGADNYVNQPPSVTNPSITGEARVGQTLVAGYDYHDPEGHTDHSLVRWYRTDSNMTVWNTIEGASSPSYLVTETDIDGYLRFEVTPRDDQGMSGVPVNSEAVGPVPENTPPVPGNGGTIHTRPDRSEVDLSWTAATDDRTDPGLLRYTLYQSLSDDLSSPERMAAHGDRIAGPTIDMTTAHVQDLVNGTVYYFNVLVEDEAGNADVYTTVPVIPGKIYLFGSPTSMAGNLGGRAGADALCADYAPTELRLNNIHAFISISASAPLRGMPDEFGFPTNVPIVTLDDAPVADSWEALLTPYPNGGLVQSLYTLGILPRDERWWAASLADGTHYPNESCLEWTSNSGDEFGHCGDTMSILPAWISADSRECNTPRYLLCIGY